MTRVVEAHDAEQDERYSEDREGYLNDDERYSDDGERYSDDNERYSDNDDFVKELEEQLSEAKMTIIALTEQLRMIKKSGQKVEWELMEARVRTPELMVELAVSQERLKAAEESKSRLEKQLAEAQIRIADDIPRLERELAIALEQLKASHDKLEAEKQKHSLQLENIELHLKSMEERFELQQRVEGVSKQSYKRETENWLAPSSQLFLAPVMIIPDTLNELTCVTFVTGSSKEVIDERVRKLRGQIVPGARAIPVESEEEADSIKQSIVDRGNALTKRKCFSNPKLCVDVEFHNEPNKLCTRHSGDEVTTREEFLQLFKAPFASFGETVDHNPQPIGTHMDNSVGKEVSPLKMTVLNKKAVKKLTPPASPTSEDDSADEVRQEIGRRLPIKGSNGRISRHFGYTLSR
ncbi:uncharacterized protein PHALS_05402 [Plasmopara halstedii]|uniref:Uncharacterized protein n=1 Tax=Plasmopara halstedii TaxID=4781 RepID=A0A0P1AAM2_PLAHL|nr:uncharacterized protein PHALS_05402 [Plasmopara halstedii]CEG37623.1 hypothetical protein PHALS_05402 [Plasmopara halstedii]|eukprot:XP_024573992.1 hypothetical protein PHALS_05402 [Plasmopara halstedii]